MYTDENPKGTIHGLGFKDVETARASVKKIESSGKSHAHKIQAAIAMEQRARVMGKKAEAAIYRAYIEKMKKITKQRKVKESVHKSKCPPGYKYDKKLRSCVPKGDLFMHIHSLVDQKIRQIKLVKTHKVQTVKTAMVKLLTETVMVTAMVMVLVTDRTLVKHT